jgi:hypothetical protein
MTGVSQSMTRVLCQTRREWNLRIPMDAGRNLADLLDDAGDMSKMK